MQFEQITSSDKMFVIYSKKSIPEYCDETQHIFSQLRMYHSFFSFWIVQFLGNIFWMNSMNKKSSIISSARNADLTNGAEAQICDI